MNHMRPYYTYWYMWPIFSVSYKMIPIKSKSINICLRHYPKWNLTIYKKVGLHFGSYLSQMLLDFASICLIL